MGTCCLHIWRIKKVNFLLTKWHDTCLSVTWTCLPFCHIFFSQQEKQNCKSTSVFVGLKAYYKVIFFADFQFNNNKFHSILGRAQRWDWKSETSKHTLPEEEWVWTALPKKAISVGLHQESWDRFRWWSGRNVISNVGKSQELTPLQWE